MNGFDILLIQCLYYYQWLIPGMAFVDLGWGFIFVCLVALLNAILKRLLIRLSVGCSILAFGPILVIINTMAFWFANYFGKRIPQPIYVENFWAAFWGGLIISVVSFLITMLASDE